MLGLVEASDAPEIVALDAELAGVAHGLHMEERRARILGAELRRNAVVIASFVTVENHEILGEDFVAKFRSIELYLAILCEGLELLG